MLCQRDQPPTRRPTESPVPGGAAVDFSKPTLDSVHTESPVYGLWGGCTGAAYRSDWKTREKEEKHLQIAELQIRHRVLKTQELAHTQASPETAAHVRHADAGTPTQAQRQLPAAA